MRHMILAALCIWSCILTVTPLLTEEQVGRANNLINQRFTSRFTYQYAYFVKFTKDECNRGLTYEVLQEALKGEDAVKIYDKVSNYGIYEGQRMVVSSYLEQEKFVIHAEYRLLDPNFNSPITRLLSHQPTAGCAIFFSWDSPCVSKCLLHKGNYNIIDKLRTVNALPVDRVFAFGKVFWQDKERPKEEVWASWRSLDQYIGLMRCDANNCIHCFINGVQEDRCYNDKSYERLLMG
ncbi:uncharacterized protein LOC130303243 [Hyla sarda]|uniref:uncharacterized protein LOC130303243 n=1 Tax=Hyla sarda TaxID=327740 RepID=UPI0024C3F02D|nr:uncharacterized protein LOC130303243 [Hyla sarda]